MREYSYTENEKVTVSVSAGTLLVLAMLFGLLILTSGCVRRPGQSYPYVSQSYAEDDVIYQGVGVRF